MNCPKCGGVNPAGSKFCGGCGAGFAVAPPPPAAPPPPPPPPPAAPPPPPPPAYGYPPPPPPAYGYPPPPPPYGYPPQMPVGPLPSYNWVGGILVTLFCCLLGGIISMIYGSQVSSKAAAGDYAGAHAALRTANGWLTASVIIGLIFGALSCGLQVLGAAAESGSY